MPLVPAARGTVLVHFCGKLAEAIGRRSMARSITTRSQSAGFAAKHRSHGRGLSLAAAAGCSPMPWTARMFAAGLMLLGLALGAPELAAQEAPVDLPRAVPAEQVPADSGARAPRIDPRSIPDPALSPEAIAAQDTLDQSLSGTRIEIIDADVLEGMRVNGQDLRRLVGGVVLKQENSTLRCDSATFYPADNRVLAYGNVYINQADSIRAYGDSLRYEGTQRLAYLKGRVRLTDPSMAIEAPAMVYNLGTRVGRYTGGGKLRTGSTVLTSTYGTYYATSQRAYFRDSVRLNDPEYRLEADTLEYRVPTEVAVFHGPTTIRHQSNTIFCRSGYYDGPNQFAVFTGRTTLDGPPRRVTGDSIVYQQDLGLGRAWGDVVFEDFEADIVQRSPYGEYDENTGAMRSTDRSLMAFVLDGDSIFVAGDTVRSLSDSLRRRTLLAFGRVLVYKSDMQARCDSMSWKDIDSTINLFGDPVLWSDQSQFTADTVIITLKNKQIRRVDLRKDAFITNQPDTLIYNQIKGRNGLGYFLNNELVRVDVRGNGQSIYYAEDDNTGYLGANEALCSSLRIHLAEREVQRIAFLDKTDAKFRAIVGLDYRNLKLDGFAWRANERPMGVADLKRPVEVLLNADAP